MSTAVAPAPAAPAAPIAVDPVLVARHQEELRVQGYTIMPRVFPRALVDEARAVIDERITAKITIHEHADVYGEPNLVGRHRVFRDMAEHPLVLAVVEGLLGDDCILSSCNGALRRPSGGPQALHRDTGIWGPSMPWMPIPVGIQTAWCIDDFTSENGATLIVPTSHARPDASTDEPTIQAVAPAGSVIAFDAAALHAGGTNVGNALRRGVLSLYIRSWLKPQTDHKRSYPPELIASTSPTVLRLLGFCRQSPIEHPDGRTEILRAPGASFFYGQPLEAASSTAAN
ncbi:MAG: phytanoyl-CoA dioxygenase family protein [Planctomycetes bacterium]|nr:phytanoyl-CoA dioxygenase family protein [Planctomycetota bacterium]